MDIRKLQRAIVDGLEDVKAQDIAVFNTEHLSPLFERVIIASGTSNRQTKALAASVRDAVKSSGFPVIRTEGEENGEWIIVDCGAAVAHIMQPTIRQYYHLEEIWGGKPVKMKTGPVRGLPKASEPEDADGDGEAPAARKPAAKKAARKTAARTTVADADEAPARPAARKTAAAKKAPAKKAAAKKTAARKTAAGAEPVAQTLVVKAPVARKAAAKKTTAAKAPAAKKAAARKAPARKAATREA
ncbi:ribosome silencing factor [Caldimonas tepidiphila]|uniref:ribosome silencing factor n=1 Tax=Caldimonas tepidiphila TaxID=2315841 RepID=UPI000E5B8A1D|nr:ribosome silencing factor [Caldimonas tepidiphila]